MRTMNSFRRLAAAAAALGLCATATASCGIEKQTAPALAGPSEFGTSITMVADPNMVQRDGVSQARITLIARDANSGPYARRPINVSIAPINGGTLSASQVETDATGQAVFWFTAPSVETLVDNVTIAATPFGANFDNAVAQSISVRLLAPGAAKPVFTVSPPSPQRFQSATFVASGTTFAGTPCQSACTYVWNFGGESSATGEVVAYAFKEQKTYIVTLSVTSPTGITTTTQQNVVVQAPTLPTASFTVSPSSPLIGQTTNFNGSGSTAANGATIATYAWDFGNGQTATGSSATTTFASDATYIVRLTVTDSNGLVGFVTQSVTVRKP